MTEGNSRKFKNSGEENIALSISILQVAQYVLARRIYQHKEECKDDSMDWYKIMESNKFKSAGRKL